MIDPNADMYTLTNIHPPRNAKPSHRRTTNGNDIQKHNKIASGPRDLNHNKTQDSKPHAATPDTTLFCVITLYTLLPPLRRYPEIAPQTKFNTHNECDKSRFSKASLSSVLLRANVTCPKHKNVSTNGEKGKQSSNSKICSSKQVSDEEVNANICISWLCW